MEDRVLLSWITLMNKTCYIGHGNYSIWTVFKSVRRRVRRTLPPCCPGGRVVLRRLSGSFLLCIRLALGTHWVSLVLSPGSWLGLIWFNSRFNVQDRTFPFLLWSLFQSNAVCKRKHRYVGKVFTCFKGDVSKLRILFSREVFLCCVVFYFWRVGKELNLDQESWVWILPLLLKIKGPWIICFRFQNPSFSLEKM